MPQTGTCGSGGCRINIWQIARQIQSLIRAQTWTGTATKVFDTDSVVIVSSDSDINAIDARLIMPMALVAVGAGQSDPQHSEEPDLIERVLSVVLIARNENDKLGQGAIVGAVRFSATDSRSRGVLELEAELFNAVQKLVIVNGVVLGFVGQGESAVRRDFDEVAYAVQEYTFRVFCTADPFYVPARKLAASPKTGEIDLTWQLPPARYDFFRVRLVRKTGSTAPTSVSDGTVVLSSATAVSFADTGLAVGTYSYSLFASYDDFAATPATDLQYSDRVSVTGIQAF